MPPRRIIGLVVALTLALPTWGLLSVAPSPVAATTGATVTFDANGGWGYMPPQTESSADWLNPNSFSRNGYTFNGWDTEPNGSGVSYMNGSGYNFTIDDTLYAQWLLTPPPRCPAPAAAYGGNGVGSPSDPFLIDDSTHLQRLWITPDDWDRSFRLTADIDASGCEWPWGIGNFWTPFTGTFDGDDSTISDLGVYVSTWGRDPASVDDTIALGVFGSLGVGAVVEDVRFSEVMVRNDDGNPGTQDTYAGIVAGLSAGTIRGVTVTQGSVTANNRSGIGDDSTTVAGGIIGRTFASADISGARFNGFVNVVSLARSVGGAIVGINSASTATDLESTGIANVNVSGSTAIAGGVLGTTDDSVTYVSSEADVSATARASAGTSVAIAGGIIGRADGPHWLRHAIRIGDSNVSSTGGKTIASGIIGQSEFDIHQAATKSGSFVGATSDDTPGTTATAGGVVGLMVSGSLTDVHSQSNVRASGLSATTNAIAGGVAGETRAGTTISDAGASGGGAETSATGVAVTGGLVGRNSAIVERSYAAQWTTSSQASTLGGFFGFNNGDAIHSFWDSDYPNATSSVGPASGSAVPTGLVSVPRAEATSFSTYDDSGWDITDGYSASTTWSWCLNVNQGYPLNSFMFVDGSCTMITPLQQGLRPVKLLPMTPTPAYTPANFPSSPPNMRYTISPQLPAGLSLDLLTGSISGTPTADSEDTTYTVTGTDQTSGISVTAVIGLGIQNANIWPTSQTITGNEDAAIAPTTAFRAAYFPTRPTYTISPALPDGLIINAGTGIISGTPTQGWPTTTHTITAAQEPQLATSTVSITITPKTPPAPPVSDPPVNVTAIPGDASALVSWSPPTTSASIRVTNYLVTSAPGGFTCLTSGTTCTVKELTNDMPYSFTVKALSAGGWSPASAPSTAVIPRAAAKHAITIQGTREGKRITVIGATTGLDPAAQLEPWIRLSGQSSFSRGLTTISLDVDGSFEWSRRSAKRTFIYVATPDGQTRSNKLLIMAR